MTKFMEGVRNWDKTCVGKNRGVHINNKTLAGMTQKLIAIDDLITTSKHGFASELAAEIRQILEGEAK